ncbi:hypothetical protein [Saccharopolyspora flava]|uniref:Uncharacterized protein n=1 Tax=Saccharopolyspora flava TaxID=95161 RepID=A0A1I6TNQ0_9PSEU|nr:hypothetical protein [Saccharopolyspora flava]SFS90836.1 hypothetical protein SAMN05660874_04142 [Saccharopolyspora flava]
MRTRDEEPAGHTHPPPQAGSARTPVESPAVPDPGHVTPQTARALQGRIGNIAVSRMLAGRSGLRSGLRSGWQRDLTEEQLHQHPGSDALHVRGPRTTEGELKRESRRQPERKSPNKITDEANWRRIEDRAQGDPNLDREKQRLSIRQDPQTLNEQRPFLRSALSDAAFNHEYFEDGRTTHNEMLEHMGRRDSRTAPYWAQQDARDRKLAADAARLAARHRAQNEDPSSVTARTTGTDDVLKEADSVIAGVEGLLAGPHDGVLIGEEHTGSPTWELLVTNLSRLKTAGVKTVYLESLRDDSYQVDVDKYLASGVMSDGLKEFTSNYDRIRGFTTRPGLTAFLAAARKENIRVRGIDGRPARDEDSDPDTYHRRAATMNTYADQVVGKDRKGRGKQGKYLVESGPSHATTHRSRDGNPIRVHGSEIPGTFPGLSDLLKIPAVTYSNRDDLQNSRLRRITPDEPQ